MKKRWHKERGALHRAQHHPVVLAVLAMGGAFFLALIFLIAKAAAIGISAHVSGHTWLPVEMPGGLGPGRPGKLIKTKKLKMPAPGGPAFECKGYEKRQQVDNFLNVKDSWRPAFGLGCADPVKMGGYLAATWNISQRPVTLVNIGANKGYNVAEWLELWAPECRVNPYTWGLDYLYKRHPKTFQLWWLCGVCSDCQKRPYHSWDGAAELAEGEDSQKPPPSDYGTSDTRGQLTIYALEPSEANFGILQDLQSWAKHPHLHLLKQAASNYTGTAHFPVTRLGSELGSLDVDGGAAKTSEVRIVTVDSFMAEHNLTSLDLLKVDTEGYDALVLQGAKETLQRKEVKLLEFEYHGIGPWVDIQLDDVVAELDAWGYDCYLKVPAGTLLRLTRCFHAAYEFHYWSNVICANRNENGLNAFLMSHCLWL